MSELANQVIQHSRTARWLHWGFIAVFIYALTKQLDELEELEDFALLQYEMVFAALFLILLIARFVFMRTTRPSALPDSTPQQTKVLAQAVHLGMYACLTLIPVTGLVIGGLYWTGIRDGMAMEAALLLHEIAVNTSYLLILGHVLAALYHRHRGDGIWSAMVPFWKEPQR